MILRLENVCKNYGTEYCKLLVIKNISYEFKSGNIYTITGRRFAGKTILMNLIGGNEMISSGYLSIDNISYFYKNKIIPKIKKEYFSYVIDDLDYNKSIDYNVLKKYRKLTRRKEKLNEVLNYVSISPKRKLDINNLSILDKTRLLIAKSLVNNPKIILIDELLDKLSTDNKNVIMELLRKISREDRIVIITSNSKQIIDNSDEVINIVTGRIKKG